MLSINPSELIWTIINFFLLFFLLRHFLYKPICEHMDARQARIDAGLRKEQEAKDALAAEQRRADEEKQAAREEARALLQQAQTQAQQESAQTLRDARRQNRETGQRERERLEEQSRQEDQSLTAAQPALAELLTRQLLREEGDGT